MEIIIALACLLALYYNFKSLQALIIAEIPEAGWKELYKMVVNIGIIIYLSL